MDLHMSPEIRKHRVAVLVREDEHRRMQAAAEAAGLSVSSWVRLVALDAAKEVKARPKK